MKTLSVLFIILALCSLGDARVINKKMGRSLMRTDTWQIVTKFTMAHGEGNYDIKIWNEKPNKNFVKGESVPAVLAVYDMENWNKQFETFKCEEKVLLSNFRVYLDVPLNGEAFERTRTLPNKNGTETYYFVLASCGDSYNHIQLQGNPIHYELRIFNVDGSHFGEEETGIQTVVILCLVPIFIFFAFHSFKLIQFYNSKAALDYPLVMLVVAVILECMNLSSRLLHTITYSYDGEGFALFEWTSTIFGNLSQFLISLLFLLMATGWTVKTLTTKDENLFVIMGIIGAILIVVMAVTGKISTSQIDSFHDYENWFGLLSLFIKLIFYFLFGLQLINNYEKSEGRIKLHYIKLGVFGSIYLLSFPLSVLAADLLLPPYLRYKATTFATIIFQTATLLTYASFLSFKEGDYYPVMYKNGSILPMNKMA